jgi:hypothetical protein
MNLLNFALVGLILVPFALVLCQRCGVAIHIFTPSYLHHSTSQFLT